MILANPDIPYNDLPDLPPLISLDSPHILKYVIQANRYLAELKGYCQTLPDPHLLLNTIMLQESKDSSAIENIVTTQDELYRSILNPLDNLPSPAKEVIRYREAIYAGLTELNRTNSITGNLAIKIMQKVKNTNAGYRAIPGTKLMNPSSGKSIYTPPEPPYIQPKMDRWEKFLNSDLDIDPLIIMTLMHYQFESIHPFADGNGRTGRILNVLYLVNNELLTLPVLYLSAYIIQHKNEYYKYLREVTERGEWENWIIYMLEAIKKTSISTLNLIRAIVKLKENNLDRIRQISQKLPAYELNELIFSYPYIKIKTLIDKNIAKRQSASTYLQQLASKGILRPLKYGREIYYINDALMDILSKGTNFA